MAAKLELDDVLKMTNREVASVFKQGYPIDLKELENTRYLGIDLSLPPWINKILWKTFRKTFYRDPQTGVMRGWNVRLEQTGWKGETIPMLNKKGKEIAFGHYVVCDAPGKKFPGGWRGQNYLDYGIAGNSLFDPARYTCSPIVAVNEGSVELLLGWEVIRLGSMLIPLPDYWLLKRDGPLATVQDPPGKNS